MIAAEFYKFSKWMFLYSLMAFVQGNTDNFFPGQTITPKGFWNLIFYSTPFDNEKKDILIINLFPDFFVK